MLLGPFLSAAVLTRGFAALADWRILVFPFLWLYLFIEERIVSQGLDSGQVFLLGGAFSFVYEGLLTKRMQDGLSFSGLDAASILSSPLEWGMFVVVWFHCLQAVLPREQDAAGARARLPGQKAAAAAIAAVVGLVYLWKTVGGHFRAEHALGPLWLIDDLALAAAAAWLWRRYRRSQDEPGQRKAWWIWAWAGAGLWLLGAGLLAQLCRGLLAPAVLTGTVEVFWFAVLGLCLWGNWRDRQSGGDEPVRRSRLVLAAAALRVGGTLILLTLFGSSADPRLAFWAGLLCDWPAKMLFYYAFLATRLEV